MVYPNGVSESWQYDGDSDLVSLTATSGSTTLLSDSYDYTTLQPSTLRYRANDNLAKLYISYFYDPLNRLTDALTESTSGLVARYDYSYDPSGNMTSASETVPNLFRFI